MTDEPTAASEKLATADPLSAMEPTDELMNSIVTLDTSAPVTLTEATQFAYW